MVNNQEKLYRYTTNGEGTFSAGRRILDAQSEDFIKKALEVISVNKEWLTLPEIDGDNLEFYWTDIGKNKYEESFLPMHKQYLSNIKLESVDRGSLPGTIVYEDEYQVGIIANHDKSNFPNPYKKN